MINFIKKLIPTPIKTNLKIIFKNLKINNKNIKIIEHMEVDFMLSRMHMQKKVKILEIGSHRGEIFNIISRNNYSQIFYITCFEPNPESFKVLKQNFRFKYRKFVKANFYNYGISDKDEISLFYGPNKSSALFTQKKENLKKFNLENEIINKVSIQTYTIKTLYRKKRHLSSYYDIIKIDAEGSDYGIALQIIDNKILFKNLMIELDLSSFDDLVKIAKKLNNHTPYIYIRDGIRTLTIEKINDINKVQDLIEYWQSLITNEISGNLVFIDNKT